MDQALAMRTDQKWDVDHGGVVRLAMTGCDALLQMIRGLTGPAAAARTRQGGPRCRAQA